MRPTSMLLCLLAIACNTPQPPAEPPPDGPTTVVTLDDKGGPPGQGGRERGKRPFVGRDGGRDGATAAGSTASLKGIGSSDFTPATGRGTPPAQTVGDEAAVSGPWNTRLEVAKSTDGGLSFQPTGKSIADQAGVPSAVLGEDNLLRLYYIAWQNGENFTAVAVSDAASSDEWVYKKVQLSGVDLKGGNMADPHVVKLDDGTLRMYFATNQNGRSTILSATSQDGVSFTADPGTRYSPSVEADSPMVMKVGKTWVMVCGPFDKHVLTSTDGLTFTASGAPDFPLSMFQFSQVELPDGGYRIYGSSRKGESDILTSKDGRTWTHETRAFWPEGEGFLSNGEQAAVTVGEEIWMFYTDLIDKAAATSASASGGQQGGKPGGQQANAQQGGGQQGGQPGGQQGGQAAGGQQGGGQQQGGQQGGGQQGGGQQQGGRGGGAGPGKAGKVGKAGGQLGAGS